MISAVRRPGSGVSGSEMPSCSARTVRSEKSMCALPMTVEDAKNFLDMERTGLIIVDERTILG
jgi:hypothetical protein